MISQFRKSNGTPKVRKWRCDCACAPGSCCGWWPGGLGDRHQQKAGDFERDAVGVVFRGIRSYWFVVSLDIKKRWPGVLFFTDIIQHRAARVSRVARVPYSPEAAADFQFLAVFVGSQNLLRNLYRNDQCTVSTWFPRWHGCRLKRWYPSYICKQSTVEVSACAIFCTPHMLYKSVPGNPRITLRCGVAFVSIVLTTISQQECSNQLKSRLS